MKTLLSLLTLLLVASCSTTPKAPDPFDLMMLEAAKEMFKPNAQ